MKAWITAHAALLHALCIGALSATLMSLSAGLAALAHTPTLKGVLLAALIAGLSRGLGMAGNLLDTKGP